MPPLLGDKPYFPAIEMIGYEGRESHNSLAFKWYEPDRLLIGKPMREYFKFAVAYWHSFCGTGADPFGPWTKAYPWDASPSPARPAASKSCTNQSSTNTSDIITLNNTRHSRISGVKGQ